MINYRKIIYLLASLSLTACVSTKTIKTDKEITTKTVKPVLLFETPLRKKNELNGDMLFSYIVGEMALRRGDFSLAYNHFDFLSLLDNDPYVAKKKYQLLKKIADKKKNSLDTAKNWLKAAPNSFNAHVNTAAEYYQNKQPEKAISELKIALKLSKNKTGINRVEPFLFALVGINQPATSQWLMQQLVDIENQSKEILYVSGLLHITLKKYQQAVNNLEQARQKDLQWEKPWLALAVIYEALKKPQLLLETLEKAHQTLPNNITLSERYTNALLDQQQYQKANDVLTKIYQKDPSNHKILFLLAGVAIQIEQWKEAKKYWQEILEVMPSQKSTAHYFLGLIDARDKKLDSALAHFKQVTHPNYRLENAYQEARIYRQQGHIKKSMNRFKALRKKYPDDAVQIYLTEIALVRDDNKVEEVFNVLNRAIAEYPDNIDLLYERALYAADHGKISLMETDVKKILSISPENANALNVLGYTLADNNIRLNEAFKYLSKALALDPTSEAILDSMGWLEYRRGNYQKAIKFILPAYQNIKDAELAAHLGEIYWAKGDKNDANKVWQDAIKKDPTHKKLIKTIKKFNPTLLLP